LGIGDPLSKIRDQDSGSKIRDPRSGIQDSGSKVQEKLILDPRSGSRGKKAPDPVSPILILKNQIKFHIFKYLKIGRNLPNYI
jgi:hypothetical protein